MGRPFSHPTILILGILVLAENVKAFFCVFWVKVYYGLFLLGTMHRHLFSSLVGLFSSIKPSKSTWDQIPELINFGRFTLRVFKRGVTENQPFIFIDFPEKHPPCGNFQLPWMIRVYHGVPWISHQVDRATWEVTTLVTKYPMSPSLCQNYP
jgi:hypothetical protein